MQTTQRKELNGVSVEDLQDTVEVIQRRPEIAKFVFRARNRWEWAGHNKATLDEYYGAGEEHGRSEPFVLNLDEPPVLLSGDKGPNPVEYVLAGLSGCLTTSLVYHAAARGIEITEVESTYEGDLDLRGFLGLPGAQRNGYEKIRVVMKVKGKASEEELDELVQIAQERSPVYDIISDDTPVEVVRAK